MRSICNFNSGRPCPPIRGIHVRQFGAPMSANSGSPCPPIWVPLPQLGMPMYGNSGPPFMSTQGVHAHKFRLSVSAILGCPCLLIQGAHAHQFGASMPTNSGHPCPPIRGPHARQFEAPMSPDLGHPCPPIQGTHARLFGVEICNHRFVPFTTTFLVVTARNLVSDSNVSKHLGFFRENKKAWITSGLFRIFFWRNILGKWVREGERSLAFFF